MNPDQLLQLASIVASFLVGITGGIVGAYVGMKVGIAKLETWRDVLKDGLETVQRDVTILADDCHTFDVEHELIMNKLSLARVRRQRFRD